METQRTQQLEPAKTIITAMGGVRATARICGCDASAVSRWMMPKERKGSGGLIPKAHWAKLLSHSRKHKLGVTLSQLANL